MKKIWMVGVSVLTVVALIALVPNVTAGAAASDFKMDGTTLVSYTGTATTVSVPASVETIGRSAFEDNDTIRKVTIPDSVATIEEYAFWGCDSLETVVLGEGLREVADFTFTACTGLENVTIPDNIRRIGIMTFADCESLTEIYIPLSVSDIHDTAFDGVPGLQIQAPQDSYAFRYAIARNKALGSTTATPQPTETPIQDVQPTATPVPTPEPTNRPIGEVIGSSTVVGNSAVILMDNTDMDPLQGDDIRQELEKEPESEPEKVQTQVLDWTYYGDKSLVNIELPEGTTMIGSFGFTRSNLENIGLPEGLTTIEYAAFYHCDNLENVDIPSTVTTIEAKAFTFTPWLEEFLAGESEGSGDGDFLIVGDGVLLAYRGDKARVIIPEGVKYIAAEAFLNHTEIRDVRLPASLQKIDSTAFEGCKYKPAF